MKRFTAKNMTFFTPLICKNICLRIYKFIKTYTAYSFIIFLMVLVMASFYSQSFNACADEPYDVYNYDRWGDAVPSQAGYIAQRAVSGENLGITNFKEPNDIFKDENNIFYIADSGNNRIVVVDSDFQRVLKIYDGFTMPNGTKTTLNNPTGVYVSSANKLIYIADNKNSRVLISDYSGNIISEIKKPDSEVYRQQTFQPQKIIADKAGNVYVVLGNITTGSAMFNSDGQFIGFYGANRSKSTAKIIGGIFSSVFSTDEKKARQSRNIPSGITNFDIDNKGFIYTCTKSKTQSNDIVKKLNASGDNIFADYQLSFGDITPIYDVNTNTSFHTLLGDIDVADDGSVNCLDCASGRVFQYDKQCSLLFICGTKAEQTGGFSTQASAIESMGKNIYVVDAQKNTVTIFSETSFGAAVHKATSLFNAGYYEEALEPWKEVLRRDGSYQSAYLGISAALLCKGDYSQAMKYAKLADSSYYYNKAFEGWRSEFLREHFSTAVTIFILFVVIAVAAKKIRKLRHYSKKSD